MRKITDFFWTLFLLFGFAVMIFPVEMIVILITIFSLGYALG